MGTKMFVGADPLICSGCGRNNWEANTRPKGWYCGNCDFFHSLDLLMVKIEKSYSSTGQKPDLIILSDE
jgi:hypothetical protein